MAEKAFFVKKESILEPDDSQLQEVEVPEWRGWVYVRSLNGR